MKPDLSPDAYVRICPLSSESSAAHLATAGADDLTSATEAAIANARAGIDHLKAGDFATPVAALETFDEAFAELGNVSAVANMVANSHPDEAVRDAAEAAVETISRVITEISLDPEVYQAISALDLSDQDDATQYYLMKTLREFRRAGVDRDDATRSRIRELKEEMVVARRMEWARQGVYANSEQKGAQKLMQGVAATQTKPAPKPSYDLNVEVSADGSVKVLPPATNAPASAKPPPGK